MVISSETTLVETNRPILLTGWGLVWRNWRCLTWTYFFSLLLAGVIALPVLGQMDALMTHSMGGQSIAGRLNLGMLLESLRLTGERPSGIVASATGLDILVVMLIFAFAPAVLSVYLGDEIASLGNLFRVGLRFFWRMFRLLLLYALIGGIVVGGLSFFRGALLTHLDKTYVERAYFLWSAATALAVLAVAIVIRLWFDLAQLLVVERGTYRIGRIEDRAVRRTVGPSWRLLRAGFWQLYLSYALIGILAFAALFVALLVWHSMPPGAVLLAFLFGQLGIFILIASRYWERGVTVAYLGNNAGLVTPVVAPMVEPEVPPFREEPPLPESDPADPDPADPTVEPAY